jgi:hypothetical protein
MPHSPAVMCSPPAVQSHAHQQPPQQHMGSRSSTSQQSKKESDNLFICRHSIADSNSNPEAPFLRIFWENQSNFL